MIKKLTFLTLTLVTLFGFTGQLIRQAQAKTMEGMVNINTATPQELTLLPGIGKAKAEQIIQMRQGKPFASVDDLKAIKGLGVNRIETLRPFVSFSGPTTAKAIKTPKEGTIAAGNGPSSAVKPSNSSAH